MKQNVICIAGAHRSGTSMLTRLLHFSGLDLGPESDLMPAASDNPDGFWENLRFVRLNDEILNAVGAAWDLPPWQDETFQGERLQTIRAKAQLLIDDFRDKATWGWKDPRNSLTMPFWVSMLPGLKTIIMVRNPLEAAYSMHKRNGVSYALGLRLWEIYHRRLLAQSDSSKRMISHYHSFFEDPQDELRKITAFIGLSDDRVIRAADLVSTKRRHTSFTLEQMIDAGVSEQIVALYQMLLDGMTNHGPQGKKSRSQKDDRLAGAGNKLNISVPDGEDVRQELALRRGAEIQHREETARHQKVIDDLRRELVKKSVGAAAEISRRDGRIEELQKAYAHLDGLLGNVRSEFWEETRQLREQSARDGEDLKQVRERFAQVNELLQRVSARLADFESRNASLTERLRKQLQEMKQLLRLLDQVEEAADRLRKSRRWKLANAFAALAASLTGKAPPGFGHLDRNVEKYRNWRSNHPESAHLDQEIQELRPREIISPSPSNQPTARARAAPAIPSGSIQFPAHEQVEVSIVIPVYNQVDFTRACLASIQAHPSDIPYEVIVVDDGSTDTTHDIIGKIPGITFLHTESNAGFIASCNRGASAARGKYLLFLNNDTTVTAGWLTALHETFAFEPEAGLVGSKLVYPDGRLQEAGGIIWRDGSGWNRGKFQDPAKPEYNYLKEVDYCSAASVMIPKALFECLGGFDPKYAPAYYEDTDLAFKIRQSGRKVLYQPLSVVVHHEGVTSGTDTSSGIKKYQAVNRATFTSAWATVLADKPENGDLASYECTQPGKKRILVIDHHVPMPDRDSGSLRMFQILSILHRLGHHVTFVPDNLAAISPYADELRKRGIAVIHYPHAKTIRDYLQREGPTFDVVILSRCDFARKHVRDVRQHAPQSRLIFDTVDLHFLRQDREADLVGDPELKQQAREKCDLEYELVDQTDETWVVSPAEKELLRKTRPHKPIEVVSNIVDVPGSGVPFSVRHDMLFIGSFQHPPNADAVLYFAREIFPLVREHLLKVRFFIIGDKAPPEVMALADEQVIVTGFQPDVSSYFETVRLSVAPLRFGAGVKGKINQSMGYGLPVVATSIAVEGMNLTNRKDVLVADTPHEFAHAVVELYTSQSLWDDISQAGVAKTRAVYSNAAAEKTLRRLFSNPPAKEPIAQSASATTNRSDRLASL